MKVFITGGAGFIGSHLSDALLKRGDQVTVLDNLSTGSYDNIAHLEHNPNFQFIEDTILNEKIVDKLVERADLVFHLAAAVGVNLIVDKPLESMITNIRGSEIVFSMAHRYRKKILITSTSEIYGKNPDLPLKESSDRVLGPPQKLRWSYSTAKAIDESLAHIYYNQYNIPTIVVRLFNTVGPRQTGSYGMVIPRFVKAALNGEDITVYGDGKQSRCFTHVYDIIGALIKLSDNQQAIGDVFNIGSQQEISMEGLAQKVIELTNSRSKIVYIPYEKAYGAGFEDMRKRMPDITKIHNLINYSPTQSIEQIIQSVANYLRQK
ncbi:GDP-mannose 4,6-dehydratase [Candidatus Kuenenbacteria bacterium]|nr:GDP-mannose 4,6-dehydratase [Candidatus Kuenenbacteria bacterium]